MDLGDLRKRNNQLASDIGEAIAAYVVDTGCSPEIEIDIIPLQQIGDGVYRQFVPVVRVTAHV